MAVFATGCMIVEDDVQDVVRFYEFPIGSYMIGQNDRLRVDTFIREFQLTVGQVVDKFGRNPEEPGKIDWTNISETVKDSYDNGLTQTWINIIHAITPNPEYDPGMLESKYKRYASVYYEQGSNSNRMGYTGNDKILREKGYDLFPVLAPRWDVSGEDVYGTDCPAFTAIGDIKQLMTGEKRVLQATEAMVFPAVNAPVALKGKGGVTLLPGDVTYTDQTDSNSMVRPIHETKLPIDHLEAKQEQVRRRIKMAFLNKRHTLHD